MRQSERDRLKVLYNVIVGIRIGYEEGASWWDWCERCGTLWIICECREWGVGDGSLRRVVKELER